MKTWAQYYVNGLTRLGIIRFSLLLAFFVILLAVMIQVGVTLLLRGTVEFVDLVRSIFFGLLVTPWAAYFLTAVVDELEDSRQRLKDMVDKLQEMRDRDKALNEQLQLNISQLHQQMDETRRAEIAQERAMEELEAEVLRREAAQRELQSRGALWRSFIDNSPDLVYYRNEHGRFSGCNRAMEQLVGLSEAQLIGMLPHQIYPRPVAEKVVETDRQVLEKKEAVTYEQWLNFPNGRKACFEIHKLPFYDEKGHHLGLLGFGRDITDHKAYQDQLEKASRDKTSFISTISHELRTPLNGVVGLSRILLDTELTPLQRQHLNTIHLSAVTLGSIFNDIIDLDKLDRHRLEIAPAPLDLSMFLQDIESLTRLMAEQKGLYLHFDVDGEIPERVNADGTRLRQILWNLAGNAIKFTEQGGITLRILFQPPEDEHLKVRIEVEDTGIGIPASELNNIFAMYYQLNGDKHATGSGIGLAVTRQLVLAMGGDIGVESELGQGTCFWVELDLPLLTEPPLEIEESGDVPPLHILLVEDVELNITVATALLHKFGHETVAARTGAEALALFQPEAFDLLLLDIQLPDMTGFDIADELLRRYDRKQLPPMVALTASIVRDKAVYAEHGICDVIGKPMSVSNLAETLSGLFTPRKPAEPLPPPAPLSNREAVLDLTFLNEYAQMVGKPVLGQAVSLFEQMLPDYLAHLATNLTAKDQKGIVSEAHKLKSAAGAIGLKRLFELAQQAQSPDLPAWWENIGDWIDTIKRTAPKDLAELQQWLKE